MDVTQKQSLWCLLQEERFDRLVSAVLPVAFIGSVFLNVLAYVFQIYRVNTLRVLFTFGVQGIAALILLAEVVRLWYQCDENRRVLLRTSWIPVVFAVTYLAALLTVADRGIVIRTGIVHGLYLTLLWSALLILWLGHRFSQFLAAVRIYATISAPVFLYYCVRMFLPNATWDMINLGPISYMPLAYYALHIVLFLMLDIFFCGMPAERKIHRWDFWLCLLYTTSIILSGTKGAILCLGLLCILLLLYSRITRQNRREVIRSVCAIVLVSALFLTILVPPIIGNRMLSFLKEISASDSEPAISMEEIQAAQQVLSPVPSEDRPVSSEEPPVSSEAPPDSSETPPDSSEVPPDSSEEPPAPATIEEIVDYVNNGQAQQDLLDGKIDQAQYDVLSDVKTSLDNTATGARSYLWMSALGEIKSSPVKGHGPMAFEMKYGTYPHNILLEAAADLGVPFLVILLAVALYVFLRLILHATTRTEILAFTIYVLTFLPQQMVSGSLYGFDIFTHYGFWILLALYAVPGLRTKKE